MYRWVCTSNVLSNRSATFVVVGKHIIMISERRYINHIIRYTKLETNKTKKKLSLWRHEYGKSNKRKIMKENIFKTAWVITKVSVGPSECVPCFPYRDFRRQFSEMEHRKLSVRTDEVEAFDEVNIFLFDGLSNAFTLLITRCCYVHCYRCRIQQKQVWSANKTL